MLIARQRGCDESLGALLRRLRRNLAQFADANPDNYLFPSNNSGFWRSMASIAAHLGVALGFIVFFFIAPQRESGPMMLASFLLMVGAALYIKFDNRLELKRCIRDNQKVRVCLGAIVQANGDLWRPDNEEAHWGFMVCCLDKGYDDRPWELLDFARSLFAMAKKGAPTPPELEELTAEIADERVRFPRRHSIPRQFVGNDNVVALDVLVFPEDLPHGYLDRSIWPVMYHTENEKKNAFTPLPKKYWWTPEVDRLWYGTDEDEDDE